MTEQPTHAAPPGGDAAPTSPAEVALDTFTLAYIECALWASTDNGYLGENHPDNDPHGAETGGDPLDQNFDVSDIAPTALAVMVRECRDFRGYCTDQSLALDTLDDEQAGHDFWLTRNGHGSGFWDRGLGKLGDDLSKAAKTFGSSDLYVGADGKVYVQ